MKTGIVPTKNGGHKVLNDWRTEWNRLSLALAWRYGHEHAGRILSGHDPETNTDIANWRALGAKA